MLILVIFVCTGFAPPGANFRAGCIFLMPVALASLRQSQPLRYGQTQENMFYYERIIHELLPVVIQLQSRLICPQ